MPQWTGGRATWVDDDAFELAYHLRRIGHGEGSLEAALAWASNGSTDPFDAARPLWEAVLVERLTDGRALVVIRAHHAVADDARAIQMLAALLDLDASPASDPSPSTQQADGHRTVSADTAQALRALGRVWVTNAKQASGFPGPLRLRGQPSPCADHAHQDFLCPLGTADR